MKLCDYGCGQEAHFQFKNGKWCCCKHYNSCPTRMTEISIAKKGRRVERKGNKIPIEIINGRKRSKRLCDYGCGNIAVFEFKNGKWCCCETSSSCPAIRERMSGKRPNFCGENNHNYNVPLTEDHKQKLLEANIGRELSKETKKLMSISRTRNKHYNWKGGVTASNIPLYETYIERLSIFEEVRRDKNNYDRLQIKCAYCGKWFSPTAYMVKNKIRASNRVGDFKLYCSNSCKKECPVYGQKKHFKGQLGIDSREVQPELRQLVFQRDNYTCQKCGCRGGSLHCHHVSPVVSNPIESADVDMCITLCKKCHIWIHSNIEGCKYWELSKCP